MSIREVDMTIRKMTRNQSENKKPDLCKGDQIFCVFEDSLQEGRISKKERTTFKIVLTEVRLFPVVFYAFRRCVYCVLL